VLSNRNDTEQEYTISDEENQDEEIPDKDDQEVENEEGPDEEHQEEEEEEEEEENKLIQDSQGIRRSTRIPKISQRLQNYRESSGRNYSQKNIQFPMILYIDSQVRIFAQMMLYHITTKFCHIWSQERTSKVWYGGNSSRQRQNATILSPSMFQTGQLQFDK